MKTNKGFTLLTAIVVTSILLLVSFAVAEITLKELVISYAGQESQYAFYNADSGIECAEYWDLKAAPTSAFATSTPGTITCNNETVTTNSESGSGDIAAHDGIPEQNSLIGGGGDAQPMSIFMINNLSQGCFIVSVTKGSTTTTIQSRGYNTCDKTSSNRFERGIEITY